MKIIESHEYKFPSHLLPALVNNEPVDEIDQSYFNTFIGKLEQFKKEYNAENYIIDYKSDSYYANSNCLYDLGCNVTEIQVHFLIKNEE